MAKPTLEQAMAQAAKIAKLVPENLQEAAFNRALDEILGSQEKSPETKPRQRSTSRTQSKVQKESKDAAAPLLSAINRTKYPDVGATDRVADRALKVLELVQNDHDVDGLGSVDIATILTEKFRLGTSAAAVRMALSRETTTVDIRTRGGKQTYHIMESGEDYLAELRSRSGEPTERTSRKKAMKKKRKKSSDATRKTSKKRAKAASKKKAKKKNRSSGRSGPKAAVSRLIEESFFDSPRALSEIQSELQHKRAHSYSIGVLSPTLTRLVRDGELQRDRNESGQYEYSKA